jgi:hypothetical protein
MERGGDKEDIGGEELKELGVPCDRPIVVHVSTGFEAEDVGEIDA